MKELLSKKMQDRLKALKAKKAKGELNDMELSLMKSLEKKLNAKEVLK